MADGDDPVGRAGVQRLGGVCIVVRAQTNPGAERAFEALMADLAYSVRAEEPGCTSYVVTREIGSQTHFAVHARFADWAAFRDHAETPHLDRLLPRLTAQLATPVSLEIFLEI